MIDLRRELLKAMARKAYTYERLLEESKLELNVTSLHRKLNGRQGLDGSEGLALARVLKLRVDLIDRAMQGARPIGATVSWEPTKRRGVA